MSMIFEALNFSVVAHDNPHHDRNNGGHLKIFPNKRYSDRTEMPMDLYGVMMKLVAVSDERFKAFPNALFFPFIEESPEYYESFKSYSEEDSSDIRIEIERLLDIEKYKGVREKL